jgi:hypothetical protein
MMKEAREIRGEKEPKKKDTCMESEEILHVMN